MLTTVMATGADIVVASRYVPGGRTPNWPFRRRLLSRTACLLARGLTPICDAASGFFLIRRDIVRDVRIQAGGFKICLELLVRGQPHHLVEVPYQFDDRELGESKMNLREAAGYLVQLWDLYRLQATSGRRAPRRYQRLTADGIDALMETRHRLHHFA
jgi:dolichol-phosphate mannosyltransferase